MREKKYHLYLTADEQSKVIQSLIDLKNNLIAQGRYGSLAYRIYKRFEALADFLGCSKKALAIRMKQLGLLKKEYLDNPFDIINIYPEGCSV